MAEPGRRLALALLAACLTGLAGCAGVTHTASAPPAADGAPAATPRAVHRLSLFDPWAARVEVRPADLVLPLRTEHVLVASVVDAEGRPLAGRRVEWTLEGAGAIVEVNSGGRLLFRGAKVDEHYAVSYTEQFEHTVNRRNPADEFTVGRGQSWCVVSSAEEGDSHVTAFAPEVANAEAGRVVVTRHWTDADWTPPPPVAGPPGSQQFLSASVFRRADRQPLAGYAVRYRILDGPPALFLPSQTTETTVVTNATGVAPVVVAQTTPQPGRNRIGVEVLRPGGVYLTGGESHADWQGADASLSALMPATVTVGQEAPCNLVIDNAGAADAKLLTVRATIPDGCKVLRTDPQAFPQGNDLVWTLAAVAAHGRRSLQVVYQPAGAGTVTAKASLIAADGRRDDRTAVCAVTPPRVASLKVWPGGPATGVVGNKVVYQVNVRNEGTAPATNVVLKADLVGLEYAPGQSHAETKVGTLAAGETRTLTLPVTAKKAGDADARLTVQADGNLIGTADQPLKVQDPRLTLQLTGPPQGYVGQPAVWTLDIHNTGDTPLSQVLVSDLLSPELAFMGASDGGRLQGSEVVWVVGDLAAGAGKRLQLTTTSARPTPNAANGARASGRVVGDAAEVRVQSDAALAVLGLPAYKMTVEDRDDPIEVGGRTAYRIQVKNTGSLPGDRVQVTATVPPQMRAVTASGPATYRVEGGRVTFTPLETLSPGQTATYIVEVEAVQAGEARFRAELTTATMSNPVVKEESTNVR